MILLIANVRFSFFHTFLKASKKVSDKNVESRCWRGD